MKLTRKVARLLAEHGFLIENVDATVVAQAPKRRPYIDTMRKNIAGELGLDVSLVSVKATTEEHLGFTGAGEGIAAQAAALLTTPMDAVSGMLADDGAAPAGGQSCGGCAGCRRS